MATTDTYRRQHDQLVETAGEIRTHLDPASIAENAQTVAGLLSRLTGKLRMHLVSEDEYLYPRMLGAQDASTVATAKKFQDEMGSLSGTYTAFADKWRTATAIKEAPQEFVREAGQVLEALGQRIERENADLYRLADAM